MSPVVIAAWMGGRRRDMTHLHEPTPRHETLLERLAYRAKVDAERLVFTFLSDDGQEATSLTYADLWIGSGRIAAALANRAPSGSRAILLFPSGVDFVVAFFGCLRAGIVAVPAWPPDPANLERSLARLRAMAADSRPATVVCPGWMLDAGRETTHGWPELSEARWVAFEDLSEEEGSSVTNASHAPDDVAFLQYTSGSTGLPRGVMVTHRNMLENARLACTEYDLPPATIVVSWLPLHHDMGLVGGILSTIHGGFRAILFPPEVFLRRPRLWFETIQKYRADVTIAPDFAYALSVRRIKPADRPGLDLSSVRIMANAAEPVRASTLRAFDEAFAPYGFRRATFTPAYGLAEGTAYVCGGIADRPPSILRLSRRALAEGTARETDVDDDVVEAAGCGKPGASTPLAIVDPETRRELPENRVGEIWIGGPSIAAGYWNRPEDSKEIFHATLDGAEASNPWTRSGDLGFLRNGTLYVTGRRKDVLVVRGECHYPNDLEQTAERVAPDVRRGASVAFAWDDGREERIGLVVEAAKGITPNAVTFGPSIDAIREAIAIEHGLHVSRILLVPPGSVPKTSSGKIQRRACREAVLTGALAAIVDDGS